MSHRVCFVDRSLVGDTGWNADSEVVRMNAFAQIQQHLPAMPFPGPGPEPFFWFVWIWRPPGSRKEAHKFASQCVRQILRQLTAEQERYSGKTPEANLLQNHDLRTICYVLYI